MACAPGRFRLSALRCPQAVTFDADLTACAALVEKADPERFAATMVSPPSARPVLFALYAFNVEVSRAPWVTAEPMIAEMRLQWWRDALEEIGTGGPVRRHEVVTPLSRILDAKGAEILDQLVAARRWDIGKDAFEDAAHMAEYLDRTAAGLMWVAARALCPDISGDAAAEARVRRAGHAAGLARFLRAVPALEAAGRIPMVDGRPGVIAALAAEALAGSKHPDGLPRAARPALTEAFAARDILSQAARDPVRVAEGTLALSPLKRSFRLWQWS